jgi:hypothetical protein
MQISRIIPFHTCLLFLITSCAMVNAQPIARVQYVHTYSYPGNSVIFPSSNTAGNTIVVMASWYAAPGTPTISDTRGNTYTMLPALTGGGAGNGEQTSILIWYALNIAAGANTVTISGAGIDVGITAVEYSGVATSGAIGITSTLPYFGGTPTTTPTSSSFSPSAGSLLFVAFADETNPQNSIAAGSGYTLIQGDGNHVDIEEDNVNSSAGSQTASITVSFATWSWAMYVVEFLPASGSSPPPLGTVLWSNAGDGSGFSSIVPAVPSATGVADVFGFQNDGTVAAITSAGVTAWTANINPNQCVTEADFQGGLAVLCQAGSTNTIYKLDGITGQPYPPYTYSVSGVPNTSFAVSTDGTIFAMSESFQRGQDGADFFTATVFGINPLTGAQTVNIAVPLGEFAVRGNLLIAGDGYLYMPFSYADPSCGPDCPVSNYHVKLFRVNSAGANDTIDVKDWSAPSGADFVPAAYSIITNADTGVLLSVSDNESYYFATTTGTSVSIANAQLVPGQAPPNGVSQQSLISPVLQREDGSFIGTWQSTMVAFTASGSVLWVVPNETPQITTEDGGVFGKSGIAYDQNGNAVGQTPLYIQSWYGYAYQDGPVTRVAAPVISAAMSLWASLGGNLSGNGTAPSTQTAYASVLLPSLPSLAEAKSYMPTILGVAQGAVNQIPACADLFGTASSRVGGFNPANVLTLLYSNIGTVFVTASLVGGKPVRSAFFPSWFVLGAEGQEYLGVYIGTGGIATGPKVDINIDSWNEQGRNGSIDYNSLAETLLHEMGHVYADLVPQGSGGSQILDDTRNPQISGDNQQLIYRTCFPVHQ